MNPTAEIFTKVSQKISSEHTLSREQRRALKKLEKHKPRIGRKDIAGGLGLLSDRYEKSQPIDEERRIASLADYFSALDALTHGRATSAHADVLIYAVNIGYLLTELDSGFGKQHRKELIQPAMLALHRMVDRVDKGARYGLDAEGLQALRAFADLHESQLEIVTQGEIEAAIAEMHKRVAAKWTFSFDEEETP